MIRWTSASQTAAEAVLTAFAALAIGYYTFTTPTAIERLETAKAEAVEWANANPDAMDFLREISKVKQIWAAGGVYYMEICRDSWHRSPSYVHGFVTGSGKTFVIRKVQCRSA